MTTHLTLTSDQVRILKAAKKRRRVSGKDFNWWALMDLMHTGALNRINPTEGGSGWPYFVISPRGRRHLVALEKKATAP